MGKSLLKASHSPSELTEAFGVNFHCLLQWVESLSITDREITFALANFNKSERRNLVIEYLRPAPYLLGYPELLNHVQKIGVSTIKSLPVDVYSQHLLSLCEADSVRDTINNRTFPDNNYDAQVFSSLRHCNKKADIEFVNRMFTLSISHNSYYDAKVKLLHMHQQNT